MVMKRNAVPAHIDEVARTIEQMGYEARPIPGGQRTAIGVVGNRRGVDPGRLTSLEGVLEVIPVTHSYKQVSREWKTEDTVVDIGAGVTFGGDAVSVIAGPCSVEGESEILDIACRVRDAGAQALRGGAFKPRTSPYSFQGLGERGLEMLARARDKTGLPVVTEAVDPDGVDLVASYANVVQIGARNMQNYPVLRRAGRCGKPILLKRGLAATIEEFLLAAEYVIAEGNPDVILCERGVRSFDPYTRNVFDLTAVPVVKSLSHLPIIADPSHGTGLRDKVPAMSCAAVAAGADGLIVEVHQNPPKALSDGAQSVYPEVFELMMERMARIADTVGRAMDRVDRPSS